MIAHYVMDGDRPLTAETGGNTNFYLYGLGAIGEKTTAWSFALPDGTNTPRQLTNAQGEITLSSRYTPWGDTLDTFGTGNFSFGYLGGVLDATTGLIYVGNGQYYDPSTGRFLTRNANPDSTNPYVPWNPIGVIVGPLGLIALVYSRKKKRGKWDTLIILVLLGISAGVGVIACAPVPPSTQVPNPNATATPTNTAPANPSPAETPVSTGPATVVSILPIATASPTPTVEATACATSTPIPTPGFENNVIRFTGWTDAQIAIAMEAILAVGAKLSPNLRGIASTLAFLQAYNVSISTPFEFIKMEDAGSGCSAGQRLIKCNPNYNLTDPRLIVHELGHSLQHSRYVNDTQGPYASLENAQIVDDLGRWVTGKHTNGVFERTSLGYLSEEQPDMYHGPRINGQGYTDWNSNEYHRARNEDFADMFMNWVYNSFDYSPETNGAGIRRYEWMDNHMLSWITG